MSLCGHAMRPLATATLAFALALSQAEFAAGEEARDQVLLLGGPAALSRLLAPMDEDPDTFLLSLNRVLLGTIRVDHRWEEVPERVRVVGYLADSERFGRKLPSEIVVGVGQAAHRKALKRLGGLFGYEIHFRGAGFEARPAGGDEASRRRLLAQALGFDLDRLRDEMRQTGTVEVHIEWLPATLPLRLDEWAAITERRPERTRALEDLAKDQRLALMLEARRRLDRETRVAVEAVGLRRLYRSAPETLYRYASALVVRNGQLVAPGGEAAEPVWRELVGVSPRQPVGFLPELLTRKHGRAAYLWHALHFAPPAVENLYLGGVGGESWVRRLYRRLDNEAIRELDDARGGDQGFPVFVRSVPLRADGKGLDLPGGPGLWYEAIKGDRVPGDAAALVQAVARGRQRALGDGELFLKALTETVDRPNHEVPALPRLLRAASFFAQRPELATPENVILVARASDNYEPALAVLETLALERPETLRDYLLAVRGLDDLARTPETELLVTGFQAGIEWLRLLAVAGRIPAATLEDLLARWTAIHRGHASPWRIAEAQRVWIDALFAALPEAPADWPGGGPRERKLLFALTSDGRTAFTWQGLEYQGDRARDLAVAMAASLDALDGVPPDRLADLDDALDRLVTAASRGAVDEARRASAEAAELLAGLPTLSLSAPLGRQPFRERLPEFWRGKLAEAVAKARDGRRLDRVAAEVAAARSFLAGDRVLLLLAPAYLVAMGEELPPSLAGAQLLLKHQLIRQAPGLSDLDSSWRRAEVTKAEHPELGLVVRGHVSTVGEAVADVAFASLGRENTRALVDLERDRAWRRDFIETPWAGITPELLRLVAAAAAAGGAVLDAAAAETRTRIDGPARAFVEVRLPSARLEAWAAGERRARVSVGERFALGLAALDGDAYGAAGTVELPAGVREGFAVARAPLGAGWRRNLDVAGAATPHLNGKGMRWSGTWPPYEAVETENGTAALAERELVDLRLAVLDFAGRRGLPAPVARDLLWRAVRDAVRGLALETRRDWESFLLWLADRDDAYFEETLRGCLRDGLYQLSP